VGAPRRSRLGLVAAGDVDDGQAPGPEADPGRQVLAGLVRPAVDQGVPHGGEDSLGLSGG